MDKVKEQHERAVGDVLVAELNRKQRKQYVFNRRGDQGPDLVYCDGNLEIGIEVVTCYYDINDAKFRWQNARNLPEAPKSWAGVNFNSALIMNINRAIVRKCKEKAYGTNCLLAVNILPSLTTFNKMNDLMPQIKTPPKHRFGEIYLIGSFGVTGDSNVNHAIWRLFPE